MKSSKYKPLQCGNGVLVKFYGDLDPLFIPWMDLPLSVEEICEKAAQHLSKYLPRGNLEKGVCHMTSLTLPMYGLIDLEHKIWTSPREKLTKLESVYHFVFRIRFCIYSSQLHQLQKLDHQTWEYLYLQLHDDFLNGRFETMYRKVLSRPKLLGFVVVGYFIPKLNNQESSSQSQDSENSAVREQMKMPQVTFFGLKHHLPRNERLVFRWPWPYFRLHRSVKETVRKYFNSLEMIEFSSNRFKYTFMNGILEEVGRYGSEEYTAMEVVVSEGGGTKHEEIDILVDPFMSRPSGISFGTNYISSIQDIQNIVLQTSANPDYQGRVQIDRKGTPKTVLFKDAKVAQSFVSCVDGYRRLRCNFYYSLSSQASVEAPSLTTLNEMRAFGPLLKADAERELQRQIIAGDEEGLNRKSAIFLIHQSTESLFDFVIVKMTAPDETPSHTKMKYNPKSGIYSTDLEDVGAVESKNIGDILRVLKKDARMIRPSSDCSLTEFFRCDEMEYYYQRGNPVSTTRSSEPRLYHEESLHIEESIIGQGQFTQVSSGSLYNQDDKEDQNFLVAIKQLKPDERKYFENFQSGMCRLAKLQYYKVFVRLYGYMMGPPIRAVMEYASLGDLQSVMINCPHPLTVLQILSAIEHLTHGLIAMEERKEMHGNLRCRNLLVSQMTSNSLLVRIGDPGMESLYNTRPLSDPVNLERLPWVAVERFSNLSKVTLESEIYSFATTCWEMLSKGAHPKDFIHEDITKFYTLGKHLPCPKGLAVVPDDNFKELKETLWKLMKKCWNSDPNERPSMKEIQRSVYSLSDAVKEQDNIASPEDWEKNAKFLKDRHKNTMNASYTFNEHVVINQSQLEIDKSDEGKLGEGYYGEVRKAKLYENSNKLNHRSSKFTTVAVKTTKKVHKDQTFQFLQEIELASKLQHRNIVTVIGVCCLPTHQLVMEFVDRGCLQKYIQKNSSIPTMAKFCLDVAEGMKYLHSRNVLHRDLAARNVLLTKDLTAKITDFGLSRVLLDKDYYRGNTNKQIPLHWCSPEAVCRLIFTKKGDVWSYGVLMWEIFSQGSRPHLVEECDQRKLKDKLEAGVRLRRPEKCPEEFYKIMKEMCWRYEPSERRDFQFIAFKVDEISKNLAEKKEPTE